MKKFLILVFLGFAPFTFASADYKIAMVDLSKAFDAYYKTKDANARFQQKQDEFKKDYQDLIADYQQMGDVAEKLKDQASDPVLSAEAKKDKEAALQAKVQDLRNMERKIEETKVQRTRELQDDYMLHRKEIVDEITKVVTEYAGPQGFDLVIDKSSVSAGSGVPFVLYSSPRLIDITDAVVTKLNATQPPGGIPGPAPSGAASPASAPPQ